MALLKHGWARVGAGLAVLTGIVFGTHGARPVQAQDLINGRIVHIGGVVCCDCTGQTDPECYCKGS